MDGIAFSYNYLKNAFYHSENYVQMAPAVYHVDQEEQVTSKPKEEESACSFGNEDEMLVQITQQSLTVQQATSNHSSSSLSSLFASSDLADVSEAVDPEITKKHNIEECEKTIIDLRAVPINRVDAIFHALPFKSSGLNDIIKTISLYDQEPNIYYKSGKDSVGDVDIFIHTYEHAHRLSMRVHEIFKALDVTFANSPITKIVALYDSCNLYQCVLTDIAVRTIYLGNGISRAVKSVAETITEVTIEEWNDLNLIAEHFNNLENVTLLSTKTSEDNRVITLRSKITREDLEIITKRKKLRKLTIIGNSQSGKHINDDCLTVLANIALESLTLYGVNCGKGLASLSNINTLQSLRLSYCEFERDLLSNFTNLRHLEIILGSTRYTNTDYFISLRNLKNLQHLHLNDWCVKDESIFELIKTLPNLQSLNLEGYNLATANGLIELAKLKNLKKITIINYAGFKDEGIKLAMEINPLLEIEVIQDLSRIHKRI